MSLHALPAKNKLQKRRHIFALLATVSALAVCAAANGKTASLSPPSDLMREAKAAAVQGKPLVILVSMTGCAFCEVVRRNYLLPLMRTSTPTMPVIREIDMTGATRFLGFNGKSISSTQFAKAYNVQVAPTVLFLGSSGQQLAAPIVGGDVAGMYSAYLENAFVEASRKLSIARQPIKKEKEQCKSYLSEC